jgi:hypothetical protein
MRTEFERALDSVAEYDDPASKISVIKQAVRREVVEADPTVDTHFTDYFNHSVAPDIVLRWPGESKERLLFVRQTGDPDWLLNDLKFIATYQPLIFTLEEINGTKAPAGPSTRESLDEAAIAGGTWITDPSGTEAMSAMRGQNPVLGMLSQALVRGGRGVFNGAEIHNLASATEDGFYAAANGAAAVARSAVTAIERHLDAEQSGRLTRVLRAVWEGHGSDPARFPPTSSTGQLTADDLSYLLEITSDGSAEFWHRIGKTVSTELLGRIQVNDPSANLQALVSASLHLLRAKEARLLREPLRLGESEDLPRWVIARGCLALRGLNWTAYVTARREQELPVADESDEPEMPDLDTLRARAAEIDVRITEIKLANSHRAVTYESTEGGEVLGDDELNQIEAGLGDAAVDTATAALPAGGFVEIDFPSRTAVGVHSAPFLLGPLLSSALPLLSDFSPAELADLRRVLRGDFHQDSLF